MIEYKKDFVGEMVRIGDYIFYNTTGRWPESRIGHVTRFTEKSIFVEVIKVNRSDSVDLNREVIVKNDFVKVNYNLKK